MHMKHLIPAGLLAGCFLSACLESQPAPDIPTRTSAEFTTSIVAEGFTKPWSVAELPDGGFLVTEIAGKLFRVAPGGAKTEIAGLPTDIFVAGQGGLLDVVLAPDFSTSGTIYLSHAYGDKDANGTALVRAMLSGNRLTNAKELYRATPPKSAAQHFGGRIVVMPDGAIMLTLGDGFAFREDAQKPETDLGKILRITPDGTATRYTSGHRNVQGLAYDAQTQTLWEHEHGPRGGDELNRIIKGQNYGWPIATYGTDYQGARITPHKTYPGLTDGVHTWTPSIAPSGLSIYRGALFPEWNGDALAGGLASKDLRRLDIENGKVVGEVDLLSDLNARVRDVRVAKDGAVLVLVEGDKDTTGEGYLLRLAP